MAFNLAELVVVCLLVDFVFRRWNIPGLTGMLLVGVVFGPDVLGGLSPDLGAISSDLRMIALITILLRAGFELSKDTLKKVAAANVPKRSGCVPCFSVLCRRSSRERPSPFWDIGCWD